MVTEYRRANQSARMTVYVCVCVCVDMFECTHTHTHIRLSQYITLRKIKRMRKGIIQIRTIRLYRSKWNSWRMVKAANRANQRRKYKIEREREAYKEWTKEKRREKLTKPLTISMIGIYFDVSFVFSSLCAPSYMPCTFLAVFFTALQLLLLLIFCLFSLALRCLIHERSSKKNHPYTHAHTHMTTNKLTLRRHRFNYSK